MVLLVRSCVRGVSNGAGQCAQARGGGGGSLGLVGLLGLVLGDTLGLESLGLLVDLVVRTEQVEVVVLLSGGRGGGGGRSRRAVLGVGLGGVAGEGGVLSLVGLDVLVPAGGVRVGGGVGSGRERLEDGNVGLRRGVAIVWNEVRSSALFFSPHLCKCLLSSQPRHREREKKSHQMAWKSSSVVVCVCWGS